MESEVITMFKQKKNGNFNETVNLSTLPKNISPLKNSHCNNLEEMIIMGADFVRVKWTDTIDEEEVNCETIRFYNEDDSELDGYYIRFDKVYNVADEDLTTSPTTTRESTLCYRTDTSNSSDSQIASDVKISEGVETKKKNAAGHIIVESQVTNFLE